MEFPVSDFALRWFVGIPLWFAGGILLTIGALAVRGTTLVAPVAWAWFAWVVLGASLVPMTTSPYLEYVVAVLSVAPILAALGAKRPQNGAWQFIVLTLGGVLGLPVLQGWAYGDAQPNVHQLFRWLVAAHVVLGVGNYLPTRHWGAALLFGVGEYGLVRSYLPLVEPGSSSSLTLAVVCLTGAMAWVYWTALMRQLESTGLQRLWLDFRDAYGAVWALRVAERLNAAAKLHGWPVEFTWSGIIPAGSSGPARADDADLGKLDPETQHRIERELRSMLRRFVSHEWIVKRLKAEG